MDLNFDLDIAQRGTTSNMKKDFFNAIGNALGAGNNTHISQNINLLSHNLENVSCL